MVVAKAKNPGWESERGEGVPQCQQGRGAALLQPAHSCRQLPVQPETSVTGGQPRDSPSCYPSGFILATDLAPNLRELVSSGDSDGARRPLLLFQECATQTICSVQTHLSAHPSLVYICCRGNFYTQKLVLKCRGPDTLRDRVSLHTEHQRHDCGCCQPGLCAPEQREGQERMKGDGEMHTGKESYCCLSLSLLV